MKPGSLSPFAAVIITTICLAVLGVLCTVEWLHPAYAKIILAFLVGSISGASLTGGFKNHTM